MERVEDRLLCGLSPAYRTKLSGDVQSCADRSKVPSHQSRSGFGGRIELSFMSDHLIDSLVTAGVGHRWMQCHAREDHMHTDEMGVRALGQGGCVSRSVPSGWA